METKPRAATSAVINTGRMRVDAPSRAAATGPSPIPSTSSACRDALFRGELEEFGRLRETIVSRLGHLRKSL